MLLANQTPLPKQENACSSAAHMSIVIVQMVDVHMIRWTNGTWLIDRDLEESRRFWYFGLSINLKLCSYVLDICSSEQQLRTKLRGCLFKRVSMYHSFSSLEFFNKMVWGQFFFIIIIEFCDLLYRMDGA